MTRTGAMLVAAALAGILAAAGCMTQPAQPMPEPSLYVRLGGSTAVSAVVDDFVANIAADPRINARFAMSDIPALKRNLVNQICAGTGGPCTYSGRNMSDAHEGMYIRDDEFDAMAQDLVRTLDKFKVPAREKGEILRMLGKMRNAVVGH